MHNLPDAQIILDLEPASLAGHIMIFLNKKPSDIISVSSCGEYIGNSQFRDHPQFRDIKVAITEAVAWLINEGLLAPALTQSAGHYVVSRSGRNFTQIDDLEELQQRGLLPKKLLHSAIESSAYPMFIGGHHDGAVFQAFKEVEIAVKAATGIQDDGVNLMRAAFRPANLKDKSPVPPGPLIDPSLPDNEQHGLFNLFSAAVLWCRNPVGHKNVSLGVKESSRLLIHASYLLELVDRFVASAKERGSLT